MVYKKREVWLDYVKLIACILVVLGHFSASMIEAKIIEKNSISQWFNDTIYLFHVQLFFICSGYLYQRFCKIDSFKSWGANVYKKLLALGIPYAVFTTITWALKNVFSGSVNKTIDNGLLKTLFINPTVPFWYLYSLFFMFLLIPTLNSNKQAIITILCAFILKVISFNGCDIIFVRYFIQQSIWFVIGMLLCRINFVKILSNKAFILGIFLSVSFVTLSIFTFKFNMNKSFVAFILGLIACFGIILICASKSSGNVNAIAKFSAKYTMPIYLMHTICASCLRIIFMRLGILNPAIHIIFGILISFIGPIIAFEILLKIKIGRFIFYPNKKVG